MANCESQPAHYCPYCGNVHATIVIDACRTAWLYQFSEAMEGMTDDDLYEFVEEARALRGAGEFGNQEDGQHGD